MNKYRNRKITRDGETFDSVKEYRRWCELRLLERAGKIANLKRQVKYVLIPAQYEVVGYTKAGKPQEKCVERECAYIADFSYDEELFGNGDFVVPVVEDTKGVKTKDYIIKRKLMLWVHGIKIREV